MPERKTIKLGGEKRRKKYRWLKDISEEGGFSKVVLVQQQGRFRSKQQYVMKIITVKGEEDTRKERKKAKRLYNRPVPMNLIQREIDLLAMAQGSRHVVQFKEAFYVENSKGTAKVFVVMDYVPITLADMVYTRAIYLEDLQAIAVELLKALQHLRQLRIVHGDVNPANILLSADGYLKLCDFGAANIVPEEGLKTPSQLRGSLPFLAPEALYKDMEINESADIWALGIVMYAVLYRGGLPPGYEAGAWFNKLNWEKYAESDEVYFNHLLAFKRKPPYANPERSKGPGEDPSIETRSFRDQVNESKSEEVKIQMFENYESFVRRCLVPKPKHGVKDAVFLVRPPKGRTIKHTVEVSREDLRDRAGIDELFKHDFLQVPVKSERDVTVRTQLTELFLQLDKERKARNNRKSSFSTTTTVQNY